ncbi:MAG: DNA/RNA non-specific endonuclease [Candidatus Kapaibacterium sp.]|jgi:endonuclease G
MRSSLARRALFILVLLLLAAGATIRSIQPVCAQSIGVDVPELGDLPLFLAEKRAGDVDIHEEMGTPTDADPRDDLIIRRPQYAVSYNPFTHNPNWVSYNLSAWWYGDVPRHKGQFLPDPRLPDAAFKTTHKDYTNSGFDRGHMCRSEERTRTAEDNLSTFYMTNVVPQTHELNAGPWLRLERYCQSLCATFNKELFVITGPVYQANAAGIGRNIKVPSSCFKIVVVLDKGQALADVTTSTNIIAVLMPNTTGVADDSWEQYRCTVRSIEEATGYDFLRALPDSVESVLETQVAALGR